MPAAVRADHVTIRPAGLDDGLLTLLVRGEVGGEGEDAVEILETNHCCTVQCKYMIFCGKSKGCYTYKFGK